jgi:uncharacterized protein with NRDE domain
MCLAIVALDAHPRYRVVIAANRDEFHARAASPAHWWPTDVLGGKDLVGGGAWFGVSRTARWALVTNFREGIPRDASAPSRGELVVRALSDPSPPLHTAAALAVEGARYHGFNLLVGQCETSDPDAANTAAYTSNRTSGAVSLAKGIHGLSNHLLDTPWPKVVRSKARLAAILTGRELDIDAIFQLLADRRPADDAALPVTGVSRPLERILSSTFILGREYGTRCSTVFTLEHSGAAALIERSFDAEGNVTGESANAFAVEALAAAS